MYDPVLGRFHTQDAFSEKYYSLSPYQYAANNPVLFIDVNGDSLNVTIKSMDAWNSFEGVVNQGLEGQFKVAWSKGSKKGNYNIGILPTEDGGNINSMSDEGKAFYDNLMKITTGESVANMTLVYGKSDVIVGKYVLCAPHISWELVVDVIDPITMNPLLAIYNLAQP